MPAVRRPESDGEFLSRAGHLARPVDLDVDTGSALGTVPIRGWLTGSRLVAANYDNPRSNRSTVAALEFDDLDSDGLGDATEEEKSTQDYNSSRSNEQQSEDGSGDGDPTTRAQNHNPSRSNRSQPVAGDGDVNLDRAFRYLSDEAVVGETFVVSVPVVDLPGLADPAASATGADYLRNTVAGARVASPAGDETVLRDLTAPTTLVPLDRASPLVYTSSARDGEEPLAGSWRATSLPGPGRAGPPDRPPRRRVAGPRCR
jgi:hypothetical protein